MDKYKFIEICELAYKKGKGIVVGVSIPENKNLEEIVNCNVDIPNKLEYYKKTYDENMNHKYSAGISIKSLLTIEKVNYQLSKESKCKDCNICKKE